MIVAYAERIRQPGAVELYRAALRLIASGDYTFAEFEEVFPFVRQGTGAVEGRWTVRAVRTLLAAHRSAGADSPLIAIALQEHSLECLLDVIGAATLEGEAAKISEVAMRATRGGEVDPRVADLVPLLERMSDKFDVRSLPRLLRVLVDSTQAMQINDEEPSDDERDDERPVPPLGERRRPKTAKKSGRHR